MKHKTLFRLMLKAVGVFLFALGLPSTLGRLEILIQSLLSDYAATGTYYAFGGHGVGSLLQSLLGLYLFFGGRWIVDRAVPGNRPYCPECGYDLSGSTGSRCNECGTPFRREDVEPPATDSR